MKMTIKFMVALLCMVSLASLSSCSKDDSNNGNEDSGRSSDSSLLEGRWQIIDIVVEDEQDISFRDYEIDDVWEFENRNSFYQFYINGGNGGAGQAFWANNTLDMRGSGYGLYNIIQLSSTAMVLYEDCSITNEKFTLTFSKR